MLFKSIVSRYDRLNNQDTAKILLITLALSILNDTSSYSLVDAAITGIKCICSGVGGFKYSLGINTDVPGEIICGDGELDHCTCTNPRGEVIELDIKHLDWLSDIDKLEVDLKCHANTRIKRDTEEASKDTDTIEERKSNILSRTIKGSGSLVDSAGNLVANSVNSIGSAAGSVVTGGFHLVGTATKTITGLIGNTVQTVGGVFEGSKTITKETRLDKEHSQRDKDTDQKSRHKRSVSISTVDGMRELATGMDLVFSEISEITAILNSHDTVQSAKQALLDVAAKDPVRRELYEGYASLLTPEDISHEVNELDVVAKFGGNENSNQGNSSFITRIANVKNHLKEAEDVYSFYIRMDGDNDIGDVERKFVDYLGKGLRRDLQCSMVTSNLKVGTGTTLADVAKVLSNRAAICDQDTEELAEIVRLISKVPAAKDRHRRDVKDAEATPKRRAKKSRRVVTSKPPSAGHESTDAHVKPHRGKKSMKKKVVKVHEEEHPDEHEDHEIEEGAHHAHPHSDSEEHEEEEEFEEIEHANHHETCRCDPDTCKPL